MTLVFCYLSLLRFGNRGCSNYIIPTLTPKTSKMKDYEKLMSPRYSEPILSVRNLLSPLYCKFTNLVLDCRINSIYFIFTGELFWTVWFSSSPHHENQLFRSNRRVWYSVSSVTISRPSCECIIILWTPMPCHFWGTEEEAPSWDQIRGRTQCFDERICWVSQKNNVLC